MKGAWELKKTHLAACRKVSHFLRRIVEMKLKNVSAE
jgi:hypothetical protein